MPVVPPGTPFAPGFRFPFGGPPPRAVPPKQVADLFGTDLLLSGDLELTSKGDYAEVSGEENLRRSIFRRLLVRPGDYKLNPTFGVGVGSYVKKPMSKRNLDELQHRIVDNISRDRRVDKVDSVVLVQSSAATTSGGTELVLKVLVTVIHKGRTLKFQPFTFSQSGSASIGLNGLGR